MKNKYDNKKFLEIINHWGVRKQLKHFNSEVFELNEAILDYENDKSHNEELIQNDREHIIEELSDCLFMLTQFQIYYDISNADILRVVDFKLDRTLNKIEEEKNGNTRTNS